MSRSQIGNSIKNSIRGIDGKADDHSRVLGLPEDQKEMVAFTDHTLSPAARCVDIHDLRFRSRAVRVYAILTMIKRKTVIEFAFTIVLSPSG